MKSNQILTKAAFLGTALWAAATLQSAHAQILFSNLNTPSGTFNSSANEVGDEIILADYGTGSTITNFSFEFFATNVASTATYNLFLYANDGPPSPSGPATPSTVLYTDTYNFGASGDTNGVFLYNYYPVSVSVPSDFTWAIEFSGLGGGTAGPILSTSTGAGTVGGNYTAYWLNLGTSASPNWTVATNADYSINFLFAAEGTPNAPTPEPSSFALMGMGIAGLAGYLKRAAKR